MLRNRRETGVVVDAHRVMVFAIVEFGSVLEERIPPYPARCPARARYGGVRLSPASLPQFCAAGAPRRLSDRSDRDIWRRKFPTTRRGSGRNSHPLAERTAGQSFPAGRWGRPVEQAVLVERGRLRVTAALSRLIPWRGATSSRLRRLLSIPPKTDRVSPRDNSAVPGRQRVTTRLPTLRHRSPAAVRGSSFSTPVLLCSTRAEPDSTVCRPIAGVPVSSPCAAAAGDAKYA